VLTTLRPGQRDREIVLHEGEFFAFAASDLGPDWMREGEPGPNGAPAAAPNDTVPAIAWRIPVRDIFLPFAPRGGAAHETTREEAEGIAERIASGESALDIARARASNDEERTRLGALPQEDGVDGHVKLADGTEVHLAHGARVAVAETSRGVHVVALDPGEALLRPNGARVRVRGADVTEPETRLRPGEVAQVGNALVRVAAVVHAKVEVRNAFGYTVDDTIEVVVQPERPANEARADAAGGAR
jgi:hypothetical protein